MQETIDEINRRGWHGIRGDYSGGNDEGGIQSMEGITLKQGVDPKTVFHTEKNLPYEEYTERENNIAYKLNLKYEEWDDFPEVSEKITDVYGTFCGEFECFGDYWVTRNGVWHIEGKEGEMAYENVIIATNADDEECLI